MKLTIKNYRCFTDADPLVLEFTDGLTAILGPNNIGKSAVLRSLYDFRWIWRSMPDPFNLVHVVKHGLAVDWPSEVDGLDSLSCDLNERPLEITLDVSGTSPGPEHDRTPRAITIAFPRVGQPSLRLDARTMRFLENIDSDWRQKLDWDVLRSRFDFDPSILIGAIQLLAGVIYIGPVRHALSAAGSVRVFDLDVGTRLVQRWNALLNGKKATRDEARRSVSEMGEHFGFGEFNISLSESSVSLLLTCDGPTYSLQDVGAGISQFIAIIGNLFQSRPSWIAIDEPESGLHPRLQVVLLQELLKRAQRGVIFSTHSLSLARSSNRPLVLQRDSNRRLRLTNFAGVRSMGELLGEMSVAQFADLGLERVLLAEGPTDALVLRELVARWGQGASTAVFSLGGSTLIRGDSVVHLAEFMRVSERVFAVIDSERASEVSQIPADRDAFRVECEKIGIECHVLERRAVENYLSDRAIKLALGPKYGALAPFERVGDAAVSWGKNENWKVANFMSDDEWLETDLGRFVKVRVCESGS